MALKGCVDFCWPLDMESNSPLNWPPWAPVKFQPVCFIPVCSVSATSCHSVGQSSNLIKKRPPPIQEKWHLCYFGWSARRRPSVRAPARPSARPPSWVWSRPAETAGGRRGPGWSERFPPAARPTAASPDIRRQEQQLKGHARFKHPDHGCVPWSGPEMPPPRVLEYLNDDEFSGRIVGAAEFFAEAESEAALRRLASVHAEVIQLWNFDRHDKRDKKSQVGLRLKTNGSQCVKTGEHWAGLSNSRRTTLHSYCETKLLFRLVIKNKKNLSKNVTTLKLIKFYKPRR